MFRYFVKYYNDNPVAITRLFIDEKNKTIVDQYWNPTLSSWNNGNYGMYEIMIGDADTIEKNEQEAKTIFPNAPWNI